MTPAQKRLNEMLALISANTKRMAKGLPPRVEVSRPRVGTVKRVVRKKRRPYFTPPRAPEVPVELPFAPPVEPVAAKLLPGAGTAPTHRTTGQPGAFASISLPPPPLPSRGGFKSRTPKDSSPKPTPTALPAAPIGASVPRESWKGSCRAVCALTGLRCRLPEHESSQHRCERGAFVLVAEPGQALFPHRERLDALALAGNPESGPDDVASGRHATAKKAREAYRERHRAKPAVSAHLGHATTEGG